MKTKLPWLLGLLLSAAWVATAQTEQWLQYNVSREGRGYAWAHLSSNAPANVALPKLNGPAWFARWETPMDPSGGRWICIDRTSKTGRYERLYVDANGNGSLADDTPITPLRSDSYTVYFQPARLVFKGGDGPITYHLACRFSKYEDNPADLLVSSAGFYSGTVTLDGKKRKIELVDGNVNGTFNDVGEGDVSACDRVGFDVSGMEERYLGRLIEIDNKLYRIEVARDGASVKLQGAENVPLAKIKVPEGIALLTVAGTNGHYIRKPAKGECSIPAGRYRILEWEMKRKDAAGTEWVMSGYGFNDESAFVAANEPVNLKIGEPIRVTADYTERSGQVYFSLKFLGLQQEQVRFTRGATEPKGPRMILASADGSYKSTNTFEFG